MDSFRHGISLLVFNLISLSFPPITCELLKWTREEKFDNKGAHVLFHKQLPFWIKFAVE